MLRAAISLADREGIESLSMRRLGKRVRVEAMSLYNHVRDKDDVLDGMVDQVFREIDVPAPSFNWLTAMRRRAISARQVLLRHPWAIGLMESRGTPGEANLRHHDAVLGILRHAGFSVEMAGHAYSVLDGYIYGFTLTELTLPFRNSKGAAEVASNMLEGVAERYPYLTEFAIKRAMKPGYDYADEFTYGLDLILDGINRSRAKLHAGAGNDIKEVRRHDRVQ